MAEKELLLLVDGNALLYRAYHAFPKELTTPAGEPSGAIFGFTKILLNTIKTLKPTSIAVCFDLPGATFRHQQYQHYKATRQKMPEDLAAQVDTAHKIVEYLEFPIYASEGFEADDCLGTICKQTKEPIIILSGDQDILQLVSDQVSMYVPASFPKQPTLYTPTKVQEKYSFSPAQMIDYKALRGDPSDNIPGIPGIGEVTATKIIQEFQNIQNLYKSLEENAFGTLKASLVEKILQNKEIAFLSHSLATIDCNTPITYIPNHSVLKLKDPDKLLNLFKELGFNSLLKELPTSHNLISAAADVFSLESDTSEPEKQSSESLDLDTEIAPILRQMEELGVKVSIPFLADLQKTFSAENIQITKQIYNLAGQEFNLDSPSQIAHILYEELSIPTKYVKKGKTGFSTDAQTLSLLAPIYPIANLILDYRSRSKLLNTYLLPLQEIADQNSRIHTSYAPDTSTGRISSKNPNLQNIPVRTEIGQKIRQAFIAEKGSVLLAADYSQIELRVAAHLSSDPTMVKSFKSAKDFHAETAERMKVDRRVAKIINFSILYGKGPFGFAQDMNISIAEAKTYIEQYFATFPVLKNYLDNLLVEARKEGFLQTILGRRRYFAEINSPNFQRRSAAEREALNFPIQGSAADLLKLSMRNLAPKLPSSAKMILTVHDELVLEVQENKVKEVSQILEETMLEAYKLSVPLEVKLKAGPNWNQLSPL